jgi:hypothetical protein
MTVLGPNMLPEKLYNLKYLHLKVINSLNVADTCNFKCKAWVFLIYSFLFLLTSR